MWLRNYYNLLTALFYGSTTNSTGSTPSDYTPPIKVRVPDGSYETVYCERSNSGDISATGYPYNILPYSSPVRLGKDRMALASYAGTYYGEAGGILIVGNGSTPVAYDDYRLANTITSGLTLSNPNGTIVNSSTFDSDTKKYGSTRSYTVTNTSGGNITVREIGLGMLAHDRNRCALVYREVLDEDIVLEPNESIVFTFKFEGPVVNYTPY